MPDEQRLTLGANDDGRAHHEIVAIKPPDEPWQLVDIAITPIERLGHDENAAVRAVAEDYLHNRAA
jgi:hypothetical protein